MGVGVTDGGVGGLPRAVWAAAGTVAVLLTAVSGRYGPARDELYFAMLEPAWGYVDQPPLVPLIARTLTAEPWLLRIPATLSAAGGVLLVALVARELGGRARDLTWAAWAVAGTTATLNFGHVFLTATLDLVVWPLIAWLVIRAELRSRPQLWLVAGAVAGAASYYKLLVAVLLVGIAVGLAVTAPRRLVSREVVGAAAIAAVLAIPQVAYQMLNGWPQLEMGRALSENNAGEVRWFMWVFLLIALGPPLVYVWVRGLAALLRREEWRPVRFLVPALAVVVGFTFVSGSQPYYPTFLLLVILAAGVVACGEALWRPAWAALVAVNAAVAVVVSVPVLPVGVVGSTPVAGMNLLVADSIGWSAYADQVARVAATEPGAVVVTANYGEAGAVAHFTDLSVYSGHNALTDQGRPGDDVSTVVWVGELDDVRELFDSCTVRDRLDNGVGVDNEEQDVPVAVCRGPVAPWGQLWPRLAHLD